MEINRIKSMVRDFIDSVENCLDDDFESWYKSDIRNWIDELIDISQTADKTSFKGDLE